MSKNVFVAPGIILGTLLLIGIAIILYSFTLTSPETEEKFPYAVWSTAEDYSIEESSEGTLVVNTGANFSFRAPQGWEVERMDDYDGGYGLVMVLPTARVTRDDSGNLKDILQGCGMGLQTIYYDIETENVMTGISSTLSNPELNSSPTIKDEVINVDGFQALLTTTNPQTQEAIQKIGRYIFAKIPISSVSYIDISMRMRDGSEDECISVFRSFLESFSIEES